MMVSAFFELPMVRSFRRFYTRLDRHTQEVFRGASLAVMLKMVAIGVNFILSVALARLLGASGAGIYFLSFTIITIFATLGRLGLDNAVIRFIAANAAVDNWNAVKGVYIKAMSTALCTSTLLAAVVFFSSSWIANFIFQDPSLANPLRWMSLTIVPFALFILYSDALRGLKRIGSAVTINNLWTPLFSIVGVLVLVPPFGVVGAAWAYSIAAFMTLMVGYFLWNASAPQLRNLDGNFSTNELFVSCVPLFWAECLKLVNAWCSILLLGFWVESDNVGIYGVAIRTAALISFVLAAVNSIAAPKFAAMYRLGDQKGLGCTARLTTNILTLISAPVCLFLIVFSEIVMGVFGEQFVQGHLVLSVLAVGQFINVATGSVGYLLMMSGHERLMRNNLAVCALINVVLNALLIPVMGIIGAAIATAVTLALQNLIAAWLVWRRLGIVTIPLIPVADQRA